MSAANNQGLQAGYWSASIGTGWWIRNRALPSIHRPINQQTASQGRYPYPNGEALQRTPDPGRPAGRGVASALPLDEYQFGHLVLPAPLVGGPPAGRNIRNVVIVHPDDAVQPLMDVNYSGVVQRSVCKSVEPRPDHLHRPPRVHPPDPDAARVAHAQQQEVLADGGRPRVQRRPHLRRPVRAPCAAG
ncbi:MAG: hypothetical protein L0I24_13445 [Pseudonocardia sp.]|nr:hypothetical protein [Pseudonocardia sp.]